MGKIINCSVLRLGGCSKLIFLRIWDFYYIAKNIFLYSEKLKNYPKYAQFGIFCRIISYFEHI